MKLLSFIALTISLFSVNCFSAGLSLESTRIIFDGSKPQAKFIVNNGTKEDYLLQSWVDNNGPKDDQKNKKKPPFITTPPIVKSNSQSKNEIRVIQTDVGLPQDRESIFWVNVKSIPRVHDTASGNGLNIAIKNRVKLFYRPKKLMIDFPNGNEAYKNLTFKVENNKIEVNNNSPFYVSLFDLSVNDINIDVGYEMVPPKGNVKYLLLNNKTRYSKVTWRAVNDFGAITPSQEINL